MLNRTLQLIKIVFMQFSAPASKLSLPLQTLPHQEGFIDSLAFVFHINLLQTLRTIPKITLENDLPTQTIQCCPAFLSKSQRLIKEELAGRSIFPLLIAGCCQYATTSLLPQPWQLFFDFFVIPSPISVWVESLIYLREMLPICWSGSSGRIELIQIS